MPPQAIPTLGLRVLLITNLRTSRATVVKVLNLVIGSRFAEALQPSLDAGIVRQHAELPWHPGAFDYRRRDEPLITGEGISVLSNALQIFLPASGALLLVVGWLRNRVLIRRELRFDRFIALVSGIEGASRPTQPWSTRSPSDSPTSPRTLYDQRRSSRANHDWRG